MSFPRIRPYPTFVVDEDGARERLAAHELVLERPVGVDLEINLAPHPGFRGEIGFSTFRGSSLVLEAGSAAKLYLFVEEWPVGDRRRKKVRRSKLHTLGHVYAVDARGAKRLIEARRFAVQTSATRELLIDLEPDAPWARHIEVSSPGKPLAISLGGSNVVLLSVQA